MKIFQKVIATLDGKFTVESNPRMEGKSITMVLAPGAK
jgi:translation initiation factor IF-3